jgi:hypothetical protein
VTAAGRLRIQGRRATTGLVDTRGSATSVNLSVSGVLVQAGSQTTIDSILLRDSVNSEPVLSTPFYASLTGLEDGDYDVYYYDRNPTSGMSANGIIHGNAGGTVVGGAQFGLNLCEGNTTCP